MTRSLDLHVHTTASPCSNAKPQEVIDKAIAAGLSGVAITDHDTMENVSPAREYAPAGFDVIPGVEVTTTAGHLLALGVDSCPPQTDPLTVIEYIHQHGGVAILAHPFDPLREHFGNNLDAIAEAADAVETRNSRCIRAAYNRRAESFALAHNLPQTGGSDAHFPHEIGRAITVAEQSVYKAIETAQVRPKGGGRYASGHVFTKLHQLQSTVMSSIRDS